MGEKIRMAHGSGGRLMHRLIGEIFASRFGGGAGVVGDDAAELPTTEPPLAFTVDSFVVKPLFFPGGDIGKLAVCGTVNDLAAKGARPEFLSAAFVLEEGLEVTVLERIADSMARTAEEAGVRIVTGDTKVVERGGADKLYITTSGVGRILPGVRVSGGLARPGDRVVVTGTLGDHGITVLVARGELEVTGELVSDCAPLGKLVMAVLERGIEVHVLRDPTRGGLATTLVEIAGQSGVRIVLEEESLPVKEPVLQACELLGLDPLYVANEGKMTAILPEAAVEPFLQVVRSRPEGKDAAVVGRVEEGEPGVALHTRVGGMRPVIMLEGDPLPRIC